MAFGSLGVAAVRSLALGSLAFAAAAFAPPAEAADVTVNSARIDAGRLVITGNTLVGGTRVRLDGQAGAAFNVVSNGGSNTAFLFSLIYHPSDCIVTLQKVFPNGSLGAPTNAVVANCGPRGLAPRGAWSASLQYLPNDLVTSAGSAWRAKRANRGKLPAGSAADWEKLHRRAISVQRSDGARGLAGAAGPAGPQAPRVQLDRRAPPDLPARRDRTARQARLAPQDRRALPGRKAPPARRDNRGQLERQARRTGWTARPAGPASVVVRLTDCGGSNTCIASCDPGGDRARSKCDNEHRWGGWVLSYSLEASNRSDSSGWAGNQGLSVFVFESIQLSCIEAPGGGP